MLFGRGRARPEGIKLDDLAGALDSSFDKKLAYLQQRVPPMLRELGRSREMFIAAVDGFERLDADPEMEYFFIDNVNFIKGQKQSYTKALRHAIGSWDISERDAPNLYSRYGAIVSQSEEFIGETLKSNNKFKKVLQSYSNHLDPFRNSFSSIERAVEALRNELRRAERPAAEYGETSKAIESLRYIDDRYASLRSGRRAEDQGGNTSTKDREAEIGSAISEKGKTLSETSAGISALRSRITHATAPLEKPARKFDHISRQKRQLHDMLADPIGTIRDERDQHEFREMLRAMERAISAGEIELKGGGVGRHIADAVAIDIVSESAALKSMEQRRSDLASEIHSLEGELAKLRHSASIIEAEKRNAESMKKAADELALKRDSAKSQVERMFSEYYGRTISVLL